MSSARPPIRTVGVEEELLLFGGSDAPRPAPLGERLSADPSTDVEHELKLEQAEIASPPTAELDEVVDELRQRRRAVAAAAEHRGARVVALATSPVAYRPHVTPDARYERMHEHFGLVAVEQLSCGLHVHVSVDSRDEGVAALDRIQPDLPVLVALTANSPFWNGADSGYASYRRISWSRFPSAGPTTPFGTAAGYDARLDELIAIGGALDRAMIYFDARLSENYPTLEIRVCDVVQQVADSAAVAGLCRALVDTALADSAAAARPAPDVGAVRAAGWYAARYGLVGQLVDPLDQALRPAADVCGRLVERLAPALRRNGDLGRIEDFVARRLSDGTWAEVQRRDFAERRSTADVVSAAAERTVAG